MLSYRSCASAVLTTCLLVCFSLQTSPWCAAEEPGSDPLPQIKIRMVPESAPHAAIEIRGISAEEIPLLLKEKESIEKQLLFNVYAGAEIRRHQLPLLGEFTHQEGKVLFEPRYPLQRGLTYRAVLTIVTEEETGEIKVESKTSLFSIPEDPQQKPTELSHIYPTTEKLPENLLRMYLEFSAPMSQGRSYDYLHLLDAEGNEIELPFLELEQELWNPEGTRLTILFDPGRVKRGLRPREEEGPVFVAGERFTFIVDARWPDANGKPLKQGIRKAILSTQADYVQPDPANWKVTAPAANTQEPLLVTFPEPLDHGMLYRVLEIHDAEGNPIKGTIRLSQMETRWEFHPAHPWKPGEYQMVIETILEDVAGNSIGRPFERDLTKPEVEVPERVSRSFTIAK